MKYIVEFFLKMLFSRLNFFSKQQDVDTEDLTEVNKMLRDIVYKLI